MFNRSARTRIMTGRRRPQPGRVGWGRPITETNEVLETDRKITDGEQHMSIAERSWLIDTIDYLVQPGWPGRLIHIGR